MNHCGRTSSCGAHCASRPTRGVPHAAPAGVELRDPIPSWYTPQGIAFALAAGRGAPTPGRRCRGARRHTTGERGAVGARS